MKSFRSRLLALSLVVCACTPTDRVITGLGELNELTPPPTEGGIWPALSTQGDRVVLSWQESDETDQWFVKTATFEDDRWTAARDVAHSRDDAKFFVNWADFAAVWPVGDNDLMAHWLVRGTRGRYDYGIRVAKSSDAGRTWSEPWTPHEQETATEHGFVSMFSLADGATGMVWLDGRETAKKPESEGPRGAMTLRYRSIAADGTKGPEALLDGRICDCCQTAAAVTSSGPIVVYRDRTDDEIRDIYVTRLVGDRWTLGVPVHADEWLIPACPVNGPAVAAREEVAAVAWFTGSEDEPKVQLAFSSDAGASFGAPVLIDDGNPLGRVDVVLLRDGSALVSWLERTPDAGEVRVRRVSPSGEAGPATVVTETSSGRDSGFPRMVQDSEGRIVFAWTEAGDPSNIRMARTKDALP